MVKTLVAYYKDVPTAQQVVETLLEAGFSGDDISLIVNSSHNPLAASHKGEVSWGEGAGFGALIGALVGIGSSLVPGIGPVFGGGVLAVAMTIGVSAAAGALTGGVTAGVLDLGDEADSAHASSTELAPVVGVTTSDQWMEWAVKILSRFQPLKLEERPVKWYASEWNMSDADIEEHNTAAVAHQSDSHLRIPKLKTSKLKAGDKLPRRVQVYDN